MEHGELSSVLCDDLAEWDGGGGSGERDVCIHIAGPVCCIAEAIPPLWNSYIPIIK